VIGAEAQLLLFFINFTIRQLLLNVKLLLIFVFLPIELCE